MWAHGMSVSDGRSLTPKVVRAYALLSRESSGRNGVGGGFFAVFALAGDLIGLWKQRAQACIT
jgi:hypothetical protein